MRLEGLSKLKKKSHFIGTRTHGLPACSIVPQPTMLPRASDSNPLLTQKYRDITVLHLNEILCPRERDLEECGQRAESFFFRKFRFASSSRHVNCILRRYFPSRSLQQLVVVFLRWSEGSLLCNECVFCKNCFHRLWKNWLYASRGLGHVARRVVSTFPTQRFSVLSRTLNTHAGLKPSI
jgi:hypothetical protein